MSEASTAAPATTTTTTEATTANPATTSTTVTTTPETQTTTGPDFIPEAYRNDPSFAKYKTQDDFYKGVQNLQKLVGQKEIVQGLKVPGENASPEELKEFYTQLGRPEAADKYTLPEDIQLPEGYDLATEKKQIAEIAFELGLSNKQATDLFKKYASKTAESFVASQAEVTKNFNEAVTQAFGADSKASLDLAKKGAKALGGADKLNLEDVSSPLLLKALAMLGKDVGEDTLEGGKRETKESLLSEAKRLQASPEYRNGDPQVTAKVREMYQKVYPS